jgi:hypothetical protein
MKRSARGVLLLCAVLMANIVCTQYMIFNFFYERYMTSIIFMLANLFLFPIAIWVYKKEKNPTNRGENV